MDQFFSNSLRIVLIDSRVTEDKSRSSSESTLVSDLEFRFWNFLWGVYLGHWPLHPGKREKIWASLMETVWSEFPYVDSTLGRDITWI